MSVHAGLAPSPWMRRWSHLVPPGAALLDVACGSGRHVRWFAQHGARVVALDRDAAAVEPLRDVAEVVIADIESGPWPLAGRRFDAVIVANYLWRPLLPALVDAVADGGVLLYETFAVGNEACGRPSNPDFLLRPGELLDAVRGLHVLAFEQGLLPGPDRVVQRVAATRLAPAAAARLPLEAPG
jgi:SAM-dependent methyltransferase